MTNAVATKRFRTVIVAGVAFFSGATGLIMAYQSLRFEMTPGKRAPIVSTWPSESNIARDPKKLSLIVFAHPYCSCTKATLAELAKVLNSAGAERPDVKVLFYRPDDSDWEPAELWQDAKSLPGSQVAWDSGGREAKLFGATTSGSAFLFESGGQLRFQGGITGSRGHFGDNAGASELAAAMDLRRYRDRPRVREFFVFGCSLGGHANGIRGERR